MKERTYREFRGKPVHIFYSAIMVAITRKRFPALPVRAGLFDPAKVDHLVDQDRPNPDPKLTNLWEDHP